MSNPLVLVLERDNPCNTTIIDRESGDLIYTVSTVHGKDAITYLKDAEGAHVAHWKWRDVRSDLLTLGSAKPVAAGDWLQKSIIPFSRRVAIFMIIDHGTVTFRDDKNKSFKWKGVEGGGQMELYSSEDKKKPIAAFQKSLSYTDRKVDPPVPIHREATLTLNSQAQEIMNLVVVSFLVLEKGRRSREAGEGTTAGALGAPPIDIR